MFLTITEAAQEKIKGIQTMHSGDIAFYYESRIGCICGNTGIFTLRLVQEKDPELDTTIASSIGDLHIQDWSTSFLPEQMKLDFKKEKNALVLRSDAGLMNDNVIITDETGQQLF